MPYLFIKTTRGFPVFQLTDNIMKVVYAKVSLVHTYMIQCIVSGGLNYVL